MGLEGVFLNLPWGNLDQVKKSGQEFALPSAINGQAGVMGEANSSNPDFQSLLSDKLQQVSSLVNDGERKLETFLVDPDSINPHEVTLALAKANMAVNMTQTVVNAAIKAYREITSLR